MIAPRSLFKPAIAVFASAALLAGLAGCTRHLVAAQPRLVRLSIEPSYSLPTMNRKYGPLIALLEARTGYRIETVSALSYGNYYSTLEGAKVDIGFMNGFAYLTTRKTRGAYPLARALDRRGGTEQRGAIIVLKDAPIRSCVDLKGRVIVAMSRRGAASYLSIRASCAREGMDPEREATVLFQASLDEVIRTLLRGRAAAAFVRMDALEDLRQDMDTSRIRILAQGDPVPNWCFAAFRDTDPAAAEKFRSALLALKPSNADDAAALGAAGIGGFVEARGSDYDGVMRMAKALQLPY